MRLNPSNAGSMTRTGFVPGITARTVRVTASPMPTRSRSSSADTAGLCRETMTARARRAASPVLARGGERSRWRLTTLCLVAASFCSTEERIASACVGDSALLFSCWGRCPCGFGLGRIRRTEAGAGAAAPGSTSPLRAGIEEQRLLEVVDRFGLAGLPPCSVLARLLQGGEAEVVEGPEAETRVEGLGRAKEHVARGLELVGPDEGGPGVVPRGVAPRPACASRRYASAASRALPCLSRRSPRGISCALSGNAIARKSAAREAPRRVPVCTARSNAATSAAIHASGARSASRRSRSGLRVRAPS
jgi:hypothetical protein